MTTLGRTLAAVRRSFGGRSEFYAFCCYALVLGIALLCFFVNRDTPPHIFWDENYHVTSAERYIEGIAHFEPHPPLGLMLMALGEKLSGANAGIDKHVLVRDKKIDGNDLPTGFSFAGMRLMPSLFASLAALPFFGLMFELTRNRLHALLLSSLYLFENAFIAHFRAAHIDSFQMFFSLCSIWLFVRLWRRSAALEWQYYACLGGLCSLAALVKVNAIVLLLLLPILFLRESLQRADLTFLEFTIDGLRKGGAGIGAAILATTLTFYAHTVLTQTMPDRSTSAGRQDISHMSATYRAYLTNHTPTSPSVVMAVAEDYWRFMRDDHRASPKLDPNNPQEAGSYPLLWPLHYKTINYRWDSADGRTSYVQLVGNQTSWYLALVAVVLSLLLIANHRVFGMPLRGSQEIYRLIEVFAALYIAFMLLNLWFITQRVMYLYHYFLGLILSFVLLVLMFRYFCDVNQWSLRRRTWTLASGAAVVFLSFLFFLPLTNHWPLTKEQCERRNVFSTIVDCR